MTREVRERTRRGCGGRDEVHRISHISEPRDVAEIPNHFHLESTLFLVHPVRQSRAACSSPLRVVRMAAEISRTRSRWKNVGSDGPEKKKERKKYLLTRGEGRINPSIVYFKFDRSPRTVDNSKRGTFVLSLLSLTRKRAIF